MNTALDYLGKAYQNDAAIDLTKRALESKKLLIGGDRVETLLRMNSRLSLLGRHEEALAALNEGNKPDMAKDVKRGVKILGLLLEGEGNCRRIVCPYHAWSYLIDGRLHGCPDMKDAAGFDRAAHGLVPVRQESWAGFLFLSFSPETGLAYIPVQELALDYTSDPNYRHLPGRLNL